MTFEELRKVNETIKTTDIKGKSYAEVNQRIKAFRMLFPTGFIKTEIVKLEDGICVMRAYAGYYNGEEMVALGSGTAYEKENSTFINKTSYIENCETSAVGRAMAMLGIGIDTSVASYEEVETAIINQNKTPSIATLKAKIKMCDINEQKLLEQNNVKSLDELSDKQKIKIDTDMTRYLKEKEGK